MNKVEGLHHLAITTADIKAQIEFFTDKLGMELVALYWMHGVDNTFHGFLRLNDESSIALVHNPQIGDIESGGQNTCRQSSTELCAWHHATRGFAGSGRIRIDGTQRSPAQQVCPLWSPGPWILQIHLLCRTRNLAGTVVFRGAY